MHAGPKKHKKTPHFSSIHIKTTRTRPLCIFTDRKKRRERRNIKRALKKTHKFYQSLYLTAHWDTSIIWFGMIRGGRNFKQGTNPPRCSEIKVGKNTHKQTPTMRITCTVFIHTLTHTLELDQRAQAPHLFRWNASNCLRIYLIARNTPKTVLLTHPRTHTHTGTTKQDGRHRPQIFTHCRYFFNFKKKRNFLLRGRNNCFAHVYVRTEEATFFTRIETRHLKYKALHPTNIYAHRSDIIFSVISFTVVGREKRQQQPIHRQCAKSVTISRVE